MSPKWSQALGISLALHFLLLTSLWGLSRPWRPAPPKVVRVSLRAIKPAVSFSPSTKKTTQTSLAKRAPVWSKTLAKHRKTKRHISPKKKISRTRSRKTSYRHKNHLGPTPKEEKLLQQKLAALKAKAEEEELKEKLVALSQKVRQKGGVSLSGPDKNTKLDTHLKAILEARLKAFWEIPVVLKNRHDLWAEVELEVAPDGRILSWRFKHRSGEPLFDEAVRRTLELANPLPPPGKPLLLPVVFRIQGN